MGRNARREVVSCLISCFFITATSAFAQSTPPFDEVIYISGGGSARRTDIKKRAEKLRAIFETGTPDHRAKVTVFQPDTVLGVKDLALLTYSPAFKNKIAAKIAAGGPHTHILASSLGAGELRDNILDLALKINPHLHLGTIVSIEPMLPTFGQTTQKRTASKGLDFDLFLNIELRYRGPAADSFRTAMSAHRYVPDNCTEQKCFFIGQDKTEVNIGADFYNTFLAHGKSVGRYEDQGQVVLTHTVAARHAAEPPRSILLLRNEMERWQKENPIDNP